MKTGVQYGNGTDCPDNPEHGRRYVLRSGREWCPNQAHDKEMDGFTARERSEMAGYSKEDQTGRKPKGESAVDAESKKRTRASAAKVKPAKQEANANGPLCLCGCNENTKGGKFRPGHDARYHAAQKKAAQEAANANAAQ